LADFNVYTVLMTGRQHRVPEINRRVHELLDSAGLQFDEVHLKQLSPGSDRTAQFKRDKLTELLTAMPEVNIVHLWDDRHHHLPAIVQAAGDRGVRAVPHPVDRFSLPTACSAEEFAEWQRGRQLEQLSRISDRIIMEQEGF
jgi:D-mannonate dehydratase